MKRTLITTNDGSHSLFVEQLGETYHSIHGAIIEAQHVYISNGLDFCSKTELSILEMGFGTGLNTFLTLLESEKNNLNIRYTALEAYPVSAEHWQHLNYPKSPEEKNLFEKLHLSPWELPNQITQNFELVKKNCLLQNFTSDDRFDLIYFDAFGFNYQPELWSIEVFENLKKHLKSQGVLVTYACKGEVTRGLKNLGFEVQKISGPPGKRQMTRAILK